MGLMTLRHGVTDRLDKMALHLALRLMFLTRPGHTASTSTVILKPHGMTLQPCFHLEFVICVLDTPQSNAIVLRLMSGSCSDHLEALWCSYEHCGNEITWDDHTWNEVEHVWEFLICYSCLGTTSAECAERGGSCLEGNDAPQGRRLWSRSPGVENGWTADDSQQPPASQEEQPPVSQD